MKNLTITLLLFFIPCAFIFGQGMKAKTDTKITINPGYYINVAGDGNLLLQADENGSASLIDLNTTNHVLFSGNGESQVESYIAQDSWHYVSTPVADATSNTFFGFYLMTFDEQDSTWFFIVSTDSLLYPMQGYAAWSSSSATGNKTVTYNGTLNTGSLSINLTHHGSAAHQSKGMNFVGNPFPSAVNWNAEGWTFSNLDPTLYMWNPQVGNYGTYNRFAASGTNEVDSIIPSKQGFFVHVTSDGIGSLGVDNQARLHDSKAFFKSKESVGSDLLSVKVTSSNNLFSDELIVCFNENATVGFDGDFDAYKLWGLPEAPEIFTTIAEDNLSVNTLPEITENLTVPMFFKAPGTGIFTFSFNGVNSFGPEVRVFLEDIKEDLITDLSQSQQYNFASSESDNMDRFLLHFFDPTAGIVNYQMEDILIYSYEKDIYVKIENFNEAYINVFDVMGKEIIETSSVGSLTKIRIENRGFYVVKVQSGQQMKTGKVYIQ